MSALTTISLAASNIFFPGWGCLIRSTSLVCDVAWQQIEIHCLDSHFESLVTNSRFKQALQPLESGRQRRLATGPEIDSLLKRFTLS